MPRFVAIPVEVRLWSRVDIRGPDECWPWRGHVNEWGYGKIKVDGRQRGVHVVAWELHSRRRVPSGLCVLHSCDNPPCCNPRHLFLGTQLDNVADRERKGRTARGEAVSVRGERHPAHRLTATQVRDIRDLLARSVRGREIASRYGVTPSTICDINRRRCWSHVP